MISDELGNNTPSVNDYRAAFLKIRDKLTDNQLELLKIHFFSPELTVKPVELANHLNYKNYGAVNLQYGLFAKELCNILNLQLKFHIQSIIIFVHPDKVNKEPPKWIMRSQVFQALQDLGWFENLQHTVVNNQTESLREINCDSLLSEIIYETDVRKPPDSYRRERFKSGWEDAAVRKKNYAEKTLKRLTWQNLGYRLGKRFGEKVPDEIYRVYEQFSNHYGFMLPEEIVINADEKFYEGSVKQITVNAYERDSEARKKCLNFYGLNCIVCGFNFEKKYGEAGKGFIHVHHLKPLSEIGEKYELDPLDDLRPVCPNCHAVLHKRKPPYSIEELKQTINT